VHRRLARRDRDLLALVRRAVYGNPTSPYRWLLRHAGCEYGDFERLVAREGVEGALSALLRDGVYLTVEEFKGRRPTVRGGVSRTFSPDAFRNPGAAVHAEVHSGGSRGARTAVGVDLDGVREEAADLCLWLHAREAAASVAAIWTIPGSAAIRILLRMSAAGTRPVAWFSQVDPGGRDLHPRYRWSARVVAWGSRLAARPLPYPRHVPLEDPLPVGRWMAEVRRAGRIPHLQTYPSAAAHLCRRIADAGLDVSGAQFVLAGEPVTPARLAAVRAVGAHAASSYSTIEAGNVAYGCLAPAGADDLHVLHDLHAVIQPGRGAPDALPADALLLTSLRPTAPLVLLNAAPGDRATVLAGSCGCAVERTGWTTRLQDVRSYEKLTAGGMTFLDVDVARVLDEVLPARCGGGPTDYQLVEDETPEGRPRLRLLVAPSVGPLDERAAVDVFLTALGGASGAERVMERLWRSGAFVGVERAVPRTTPSGKILHLHRSTPATAGRA